MAPDDVKRRAPCLTRILLLGAVLLASTAGHCDAAGEPLTQKEAKRRLVDLKRTIASLQERLAASREAHRAGQAQLRDLDLALQETTRELRSLDAARAAHRRRKAELEREREAESRRIRGREHELSAQLALTYRLARQSRIKLVLNQDDPLRLARLLAYHDHINRAQAERIAAMREALARLESLYRRIDAELAALDTLRRQHQESLQARQRQRAERENLLAELASRIGNEESRLTELQRDQADLEQLVERLGDALADIPVDLGREIDLEAQKGRLELPVNGRVRHAFGQPRAAGLYWQGWLLEAPAGTEVRGIAHGRVAFADWFRGYGLMLIIDHGRGFLSLYGYNESLLWEVGDWVEPGAVIATVGTGPGGEEGLYFELRKNGMAVDPAAWLKR